MAKNPHLPSVEELISFINDHEGRLSRREIARAFGLKDHQRLELRNLIKELVRLGHLKNHRTGIERTALPKTLLVEIIDIDEKGRVVARPADPALNGNIHIIEKEEYHHRVGDRLRVRILEQREDFTYTARCLEVLSDQKTRITGVFVSTRYGAFLEPTERGWPPKIPVIKNLGQAKSGMVVLAIITDERRKFVATIESVIGDSHDPKILSLITIHNHQLPLEFHTDALEEAAQGTVPPLEGRVDLRDIPLVTIDGENARDFDDAIFAEPDETNPGGWHLIVAIADVSHYVRLGSALDREAQNRGNSVYLPDRVIPMLPEALSNELCSLKPHVDRGCLGVHIWIDGQGRKKQHKFFRGLMRSRARLTYTLVQRGIDQPSQWDESILPLEIVKNLHAAYTCLKKAREYRGTLDIDVDEAEVHIDEQGVFSGVRLRPRFESHKIIEEFMIAANVAAAETLEQFKIGTIYRTHELPDPMKIEDLRAVLNHLKIQFPKGTIDSPKALSKVLAQVRGTSLHRLVNKLVLRTQARAIYSPDNHGHFGLNLPRYAHFTSPIRRYADLLVHHGLLTAMKLTNNAPLARPQLERVARHITLREHQADQAERSLRERFIIHHLQSQVGARFRGIVDGVIKYGIFVELDHLPVSGFVPREMLSDDFYRFDPRLNHLQGRKPQNLWQMGDLVEVEVVDANALSKKLTFKIVSRLKAL